MEQEKIYKPKSCELCPVVRKDKGKIKCGCCHDLEALSTDPQQKYEMWKKCHIDWDIEEKKEPTKKIQKN